MDEMRYTSFQEDINVNLGTYYQTVGVRVGSDLLSSRNVGSWYRMRRKPRYHIPDFKKHDGTVETRRTSGVSDWHSRRKRSIREGSPFPRSRPIKGIIDLLDVRWTRSWIPQDEGTVGHFNKFIRWVGGHPWSPVGSDTTMSWTEGIRYEQVRWGLTLGFTATYHRTQEGIRHSNTLSIWR